MQTQKTIRAAVIQHANTKDKKQNLAESLHWIEQAAKAGAQLVLLQELHGTLYFCQEESWDAFELAEPLDGLTVQTLKQCAKDHQIVLVGSFFEKRAPGIYHNTAVVIEKNGALAGILCPKLWHKTDKYAQNQKARDYRQTRQQKVLLTQTA